MDNRWSQKSLHTKATLRLRSMMFLPNHPHYRTFCTQCNIGDTIWSGHLTPAEQYGCDTNSKHSNDTYLLVQSPAFCPLKDLDKPWLNSKHSNHELLVHLDSTTPLLSVFESSFSFKPSRLIFFHGYTKNSEPLRDSPSSTNLSSAASSDDRY